MSAALPYHTVACPTCDGTGRRPEDCQAEPEHDADTACDGCPDCYTCDGAGKVYWEWSEDGDGPCDERTQRAQREAPKGLSGEGWSRARLRAHYAQPDVPIAHWGGVYISVCRPCALRLHAEQCGCDRWPKGES